MKHIVRASVIAALVVGSGAVAVAPAQAFCPGDGFPTRYSITTVARSSVPTNLMSAYITGPGTITFTQEARAIASATISASVTAEANAIFAKASVTAGVALTGGKEWASGFSYALPVPAGLHRRMRMFEQSRSFRYTVSNFNPGLCRYTVRARGGANAPLVARFDEWKLVA